MGNGAELRVAGVKLDTWSRVEVSASMVEMTPTFDFEFTHTAPLQPLPVRKGYPCEVYLGGHLAITGHVDRVSHRASRTEGTSTYRVTGRGKTADLADCSARHPSGRFRDAGLLTIAQELAKPYGIKVQIGESMDPVALAKLFDQLGTKWPRYKMRVGDTVFGALAKGAKERGCLLMEAVDGSLVLTRSGGTTLRTALEAGKNVEDWALEEDGTHQFSEYEVLGQRWGSNAWNGDKARGARATVPDVSAMRFRPLTLKAERSVDSAALEARALWERNLREGMSEQVVVTVPGWTWADPKIPGDTLWRPNRLVRAKNDSLEIDDTYLIVDCRYSKSRDGSSTTMSLAPPTTFAPFEKPPKKKQKKGGLTNAQKRVIVEGIWRNAYLTTVLSLAESKHSKVNWFEKNYAEAVKRGGG